MDVIEWVLLGELRMPPDRETVDPMRLIDERHRFGSDVTGMPPLLLHRGKGGQLMIVQGVTRATRVHYDAPAGTLVPAVVIEEDPGHDVSGRPRIGEQFRKSRSSRP